jgi:hypothetical protein
VAPTGSEHLFPRLILDGPVDLVLAHPGCQFKWRRGDQPQVRNPFQEQLWSMTSTIDQVAAIPRFTQESPLGHEEFAWNSLDAHNVLMCRVPQQLSEEWASQRPLGHATKATHQRG